MAAAATAAALPAALPAALRAAADPVTVVPLLTVDAFARTILATILDAPVARADLAALFLAASAAWEHAVREHGWRPAAPAPPPPPPPRRPRRGEDDAEQRALACFCTHAGHACAACESGAAIEGPRYVCATCCIPAPSLCAACRKKGMCCGAAHGSHAGGGRFTVLEHPWEADVEYAAGAGDVLKVPRAPLSLGDAGPRVMHLHYVLYKMGYLRVSDARLCVGVFCERTRDTLARFQRDHELVGDEPAAAPAAAPPAAPPVAPAAAAPSAAAGAGWSAAPMPLAAPPRGAAAADELGVFTVRTRRAILNLFHDVELRYSRARCCAAQPADPTHLRTATAA